MATEKLSHSTSDASMSDTYRVECGKCGRKRDYDSREEALQYQAAHHFRYGCKQLSIRQVDTEQENDVFGMFFGVGCAFIVLAITTSFIQIDPLVIAGTGILFLGMGWSLHTET